MDVGLRKFVISGISVIVVGTKMGTFPPFLKGNRGDFSRAIPRPRSTCITKIALLYYNGLVVLLYQNIIVRCVAVLLIKF